ncbi:hypothetical protein L4D20_09040 [Vibrio kyushuensis]|uniref:DUF6701 domain-containing protein n=1 Tax=Vibrio kyushuensis TaxID=2910249 RepID=UPI003D14A617
MRKMILAICLLFLSSAVFANICVDEIRLDQNFTIEATYHRDDGITSTPSSVDIDTLYLSHGHDVGKPDKNHTIELWSQARSSALFYEPSASDVNVNDIRIVFQFLELDDKDVEGNFYYYLRVNGGTWELRDTKINVDLDMDGKESQAWVDDQREKFSLPVCIQDGGEIPDPEFPEVCPVADVAIQAWDPAKSELHVKGNSNEASITGTYNFSGRVGFSKVKDSNKNKTLCDGAECIAEPSLLISEPPIINVWTNGPKLKYKDANDDITIPAGVYEEIKLEKGTYRMSGDYYIGDFEVSKEATLILTGRTRFIVEDLEFEDSNTHIQVDGNLASNLIIWSEDEVEIKLDADKPLYASIFAREKVKLKGNTVVYGSVTTDHADMENNAQLIYRESGCEDIPIYVEDAQYEFGVASCSGGSCSIPLTKNYTNIPVAFVMPTISISNPDSDAPATIVVTSVTKNEVTIEQVVAPNNGSDPSLVSQPMTEISYLVIEPGVANFNGHEVIAGYLDTDANNSKSHNGHAENVYFSQFGKQGSFDSPIVLHQIQTRNNGNKWMTSGKVKTNDDDNRARLLIELSASRDSDHTYIEERIAFLATNSVNHLEVNNYEVQFARGFNSIRQQGNEPMVDGCTGKFATTSVDFVDGIIANKQERRGGDGGWARRCQIVNDNEVSFVIDEDYPNRTHLEEELGYFAFENLDIDIDLCTYFPEPAQSWNSNTTLNITNQKGSGANYPYHIGGWSEDYIVRNLNGGSLQTGFDNMLDNSEADGTCDVGSCSAGGEKASTPFNISPNFNDKTTFELTDGNYQSTCDSNSEYCSYTESASEVRFSILKSMGDLTVNNYGAKTFVIEFENISGDYGLEIERYHAGGKVNTIFKSNSVVTFRTFLLNDGSLIFGAESGVTINIVESWSAEVEVDFNDIDDSNDLIMYGPQAAITFKNVKSDFTGFMLANAVSFENPITVFGGVTTNYLTMKGDSTIVGQGVCLSPPPSSTYSIVITPSLDIALTCDDIPLTATVYKDDAVHTSYSGDITLSVNGSNIETKAATSGIAEFDLTYEQVSNVSAKVTTTIDSTAYDDSGSYEFVPYLYELTSNPLQVIAGKPQSFEIRPMECSSNGSPISSSDYEGVKTLELSTVSYDAPSSPANSAVISLLNSSGSWIETPVTGTTSLSLEFSSDSGEVVASSELIYPESGKVSYSLSGEQCIDDEDGNPICKTFSGSQTVESIPWKIAICNVEQTLETSNKNPSTTTGTPGFMPSGEAFNATYIPIVHEDYMGGSSDDCSFTITENYAVDNGPLNLDFTVNYPTGGTVTQGELTPATIPSFSDISSTLTLEHTWDEVGTIDLTTSANYLGRDVDDFVLGVGRFYPAFFQVSDTRWNYPGSLSHVYMGQPFDGLDFDVEALNSNNGAVQNYPLFATGLKAKFNLFEDSSFGSRFVSPAFGDGSWAVNNSRSIGTFNNTAANDCSDSICWNKQDNVDPDGPFNAAEDIEDSNIILDGTLSVINTDPIAYTTNGEILTDQPDIRFGRINLKDVGGNQDTNISVPLTVEYWNGSRFITNTDDSNTSFDGDDYCQQVIWSDLSGNASLSEDGTVSLGESRSLLATQSTSTREQIRFWLTLHNTDGTNSESDSCGGSDNGLPWLRYNWDGEGDDEEDPSTVVTFGIHRGNDRVIYRGETGLTGQ